MFNCSSLHSQPEDSFHHHLLPNCTVALLTGLAQIPILTESELCMVISALAWRGEVSGAGWLITTALLSASLGDGGGVARCKAPGSPCSHRL